MSSSGESRSARGWVMRSILRGVRPLARPILARIQFRMRGALEETAESRDLWGRLERIEAHLRDDTAERQALQREAIGRLGRIEAQVTAADPSSRLWLIEARLGEMGQELAQAEASLLTAGERVEHQAEMFILLTQRLQLAIDALRLDHQEAGPALEEGLGRLRMAMLEAQEGHGEALAQRLEAHVAVLTGRVEGRADALAGLIEDRADGLGRMADKRSDALSALVREGMEVLSRRLKERADTLMGLVGDRTERLLGRVALPLGDAVMLRMPEGYLLAPAEDEALVAAMVESGGRLEPGTVAVIRALLREGDVALDVGANLGLTVLPAASCVGASGRVIAVEPAGAIHTLLLRSLAMNGLDGRVTLHRCAAGAEPGEGELNLGVVCGHSSLLGLPNAVGTETVAVRPLDALVPPGTTVRLAKIDVEGYEIEAWRGMARIVAENPGIALLVEFGPAHLARAGLAPSDWMAFFAEDGFAAFEVDEADGTLRAARPMAELAQLVSVNLLMLREPPSAYPELRFV